ncbi:MAG: DUF4886 domain-containing protein, partial [Alistipes sp.]|nr:DUF4886 domain-containing protein [Alistipes sp.]
MIRGFAFRCVLLLLALLSAARAEAKPTTDTNGDGKLRILAIGNSFADDAMEYLPKFTGQLECEHVELARLYIGGCSLERHVREYRSGKASYDFYHYDSDSYDKGSNLSHNWSKSKSSMEDALKMGEWDVITMQQVSGYSGIWESYQPHLDELVAIVRKHQPKARLAWHMTWSYSQDSKHGDFKRYGNSQEQMDNAIVATARKVYEQTPYFDYMIPSGVAIEALRHTINNPPKDLTRDGYHLDLGMGRYAAACVWYKVLIEPFTGKRLRDSEVFTLKGDWFVTLVERAYCITAAERAAKKLYWVEGGFSPKRRLTKRALRSPLIILDTDRLGDAEYDQRVKDSGMGD